MASYFDFLQDPALAVKKPPQPLITPPEEESVDGADYITDLPRRESTSPAPVANRAHTTFMKERGAAKDNVYKIADSLIERLSDPALQQQTATQIRSERPFDVYATVHKALISDPNAAVSHDDLDSLRKATTLYWDMDNRPEAKEIDAITQKHDQDAQAKTQAALSVKPQTQDPNHPSKSPEEAMKANGVPEIEFYRGILELADKLGVKPQDPVNFGLALRRVLSEPGMEDVRQDFEDEAKRMTGMKFRQASTGKEPPQRKPEDVERDLMEQDYKELAQQDPFHNWGNVLAFVVLSMVLGPGVARMFFRKSMRAGELEREIAGRNERIEMFRKEEADKNEAQRRESEFIRRLTAEGMMRQMTKEQDDQADFKRNIILKGIEDFMQAKKTAASPEEGKYIDSLKNSWSRSLAMARRLEDEAAQLEKMGQVDQANHKREIAQTYADEASKIHDDIEKKNARRFKAAAAASEGDDSAEAEPSGN